MTERTDANVVEMPARPCPLHAVQDPPAPESSLDEDLTQVIRKIEALQTALDEARGELEDAVADRNTLAMTIEEYRTAGVHALDPARDLFTDIHRDLQHEGPWMLCRDPLCERLEAFVFDQARDLQGILDDVDI